jgi:TolB-like protein
MDDHTVDAITEDLTTALARWPNWLVTARQSAFTYKGKPLNIQRIGDELGVRFAAEGSVRRIGATLRVSVRLISAETGAHLWADHFDASPTTGGYTLEDVVRHMALDLAFKLLDVESARITRENPDSSDAADALMRARAALYARPPHPQTQDQVIATLERALALDPNNAVGWAGLAEALVSSIDLWTDDPTTPAKIRRAEQAVIRGELLAPEERLVMGVRVAVLLMQGRCTEVRAAAQHVSAAHPNLAGPSFQLGICLMRNGQMAEAIPHFEQSIRVNPRNPGVFTRYQVIGYSLLFLERYNEAITWFQKTLAAHPANSARNRGNLYAAIAAAQALAGNTTAARDSAADVARLWPTLTARSYYPIKVFSPIALAQVDRIRDGLRLAGIRDHADEDADPGLPTDDVLRTTYDAPTPAGAPGVRTIRTADLAALIEQRKPMVLDASNPWGPSVPSAIVLPGAGLGGSISDDVQERLRRKMEQLTRGDRTTPIVTVGWNAERFQGRNLALRLVALGYTDVSWHRGGREAWMVAGLPTAEVVSQEW